jgi:hypothetical protein
VETTFTKPKIEDFAAATANVLKVAFWNKSPEIAKNFSALGKPMGDRSVRRQTEPSKDVPRRNILENTFLLLGACYRTSPKTFEIVWLYMEAFAEVLRGKVRIYRTLDEQYAEYKYRASAVERAYLSGDRKELLEALAFADHSLKGLFAKLILII